MVYWMTTNHSMKKTLILFGCLICGLIINISVAEKSSPIELNLPISVANNQNPENSSIIFVSKEGIWLNNFKVETYENVASIPDTTNNPIIISLKKALNKTPDADSRNILIKMDKELPFNIIYSLMNTCASADFHSLCFATKHLKDDLESSIKLNLPEKNSSKPFDSNRKRLSIVVIISDTMMTVNSHLKTGNTPDFIDKAAFDSIYIDDITDNHFSIFNSILETIHKQSNGKYSSAEVIFGCDKSVKYQFLISTMDIANSVGFSNFNVAKLRSSGKPSANGPGTGPRPKKNIMKTVMDNIGDLKNLYNKRLKDNPKLSGKIISKFAIDEYGKVIFAKNDSSTVGDKVFENQVLESIKKWNFGKIDAPGDVTEVIYPFNFNR